MNRFDFLARRIRQLKHSDPSSSSSSGSSGSRLSASLSSRSFSSFLQAVLLRMSFGSSSYPDRWARLSGALSVSLYEDDLYHVLLGGLSGTASVFLLVFSLCLVGCTIFDAIVTRGASF